MFRMSNCSTRARTWLGLAALTAAVLAGGQALADAKYGPGTSATEIKVGQTIAHSGPASA